MERHFMVECRRALRTRHCIVGTADGRTTMSAQPASNHRAHRELRQTRATSVTLHCGVSVMAHDGEVGSVAALIIDVRSTEVTHLVVTNADMANSGRLVPL